MRKALLLGFISLLLLCTGCISTMLRETETTDQEMPAIRSAPEAPVGDARNDWESKVTLWLPDKDFTLLQSTPRTIRIRAGQTKQEACVEALLKAINESGFGSGGQPLALAQVSNAVESTGELVTVNLHPSARRLVEKDFFMLRVAITNTLTGLGEMNYANILVNGRDIGLDVKETLPSGLMTLYPRGEVLTYWTQMEAERINEDMELRKCAALYFVSEDGKALLGKVRNISFLRRDTVSYAKTLLNELSIDILTEPNRANDVRVIAPTAEWYLRDPVHVREPETATNYIEIHFVNYLDDYLIPKRISRSMLFSSITYTLTSFIPQLEGVKVFVGDQAVTQMTLMDGSEWVDAGGIMRREHFAGLSSDSCKVYYPLADQSGIRAVNRPIAQRFRTQPRALLRQLMAPAKNATLADVFPPGISDADILGILVDGDTILVNLSDAFQRACRRLNEDQERNLIYCMVNTLTEIEAIRRVRFYVNGEQKPLAGNVSMQGEFWRHPGAVK